MTLTLNEQINSKNYVDLDGNFCSNEYEFVAKIKENDLQLRVEITL